LGVAESKRILISPEQREQLERWLAGYGTPQQLAMRCRVVLAAAEGVSEIGIAGRLQVNRHTVRLWRQRFVEQGPECLWEIAPGRGRKAVFGPERIKAVVDATLRTKPKGARYKGR
jgi:transposase